MRREKFGVGRLIYDAEIYDAQDSFGHDVPFYLQQARLARGPVLELCCGTGRITIPLLKHGIDITGVDITASMLAGARKKAAVLGLPDVFRKGDMRLVRLGRKFGLVLIPFNSLQHIYTVGDLERVFKTVRAHMARGARFVFEVFNPSIGYMAKLSKLKKGKYKFRLADGRKVFIDEICRYDSAAQVNRVSWTYRIDGRRASEQQLDMRCFYPLEMQALLKYNGFKIIRKYGGFGGEPFSSESMKQIFVCERV